MTFEEAAQQYAVLRQQRDLGQLPDLQFRQMVGQLTVIDAQGAYWQLEPDSAQWMVYDGTGWVVPGAVPAPAVAGPQPYGPPDLPLQPAGPQPYGSPDLPLQAAEPASPPAAQKLSWGQTVWDVISVGGSAVMAAAWYWYSGMADTAPDKKTCIAMIVLPIALIVLRKPLDAILRPLEPVRSKIPPMVLAGCGVAIPLLIANYLYSRGNSQFPFMFKTYVYSTILSYVVLRTPAGGRVVAPHTVIH